MHIPHDLLNGNAHPGLAKLPREDITDYIPVHYERMPKPSNARFAKINCARLGQILPPGSGPKAPPRKDLSLKIVPDDVPPRQNKRAQNQWLWQRKEMQRMEKIAQQRMEEDMMEGEEREKRPSDGRKARCDLVTSVAVSFV